MTPSSKLSSKVDLLSCDLEPTQNVGKIQNHGVLLACCIEDKVVRYASDNATLLFSEDATTILNKSIYTVVDKNIIGELFDILQNRSLTYREITLQEQAVTLIIHKSGGLFILEFDINTVSLNPLTYQMRLTESVSDVKTISDVPGKINSAISTFRKYLGYDRVVVYQLDSEGGGSVIAEQKEEQLDSWLGLRFPADDFPLNEHQLYLEKRVRIACDTNAETIKILSSENYNIPLDLSFAGLRTLTSLHSKRLESVKVVAKLTVAIVHNNSLWGLVIGYHYSPKYINFYQRLNCAFLAETLGTEIYLAKTNQALEALKKSASVRSHLIDQVNIDKDVVRGLSQFKITINDLTDSHGAALYIDNEITTVGRCPADAEIISMIEKIKTLTDTQFYHTHCLQKDFAEAKAYEATASGVLCVFMLVNNAAMLWFKPETVKTINWTRDLNNPDKLLATNGNLESSGKALKKWSNVQEGTSEPWAEHEISEGKHLQKSIQDIIILAKYKEVTSLNDRLKKSYEVLESFSYSISHDLRAPLRGIDGFAHILKEDCYEDLSDFSKSSVDTIISSTNKMNNLIDDILEYSGLSKRETSFKEFPIDVLIQELLLDLQSTYSQVKVIVEANLPSAFGDRKLAITLVKNLLENAMKYSSRVENPEVRIGCIDGDTFFVKDNGIGFDMKHKEKVFGVFERLVNNEYPGSGIGLAIAKRVVDKHEGKIWVDSQKDQGSTFYFRLS